MKDKKYEKVTLTIESFMMDEFKRIAKQKGISTDFLISWIFGQGIKWFKDQGLINIPSSFVDYAKTHQKEMDELKDIYTSDK